MKKKVREENINSWDEVPFVSVCTPTFNRRPFIKMMLACFDHQTYPKDKIEWIIIDDGTDKIGDLVKYHPNVSYFEYDTKMPLGKKRNLMHKKSKGDIIVYMDDDDYYPPERIQHAVYKLITNKHALCGGSSEMYIYFKHIDQMYQFGPYGEKHATAGTFAFKRKLLKQTRYEDDACLAEEKLFLKNYTIPFVQFDSVKTILVFSHIHNTYDKKQLLENQHPKFVKPSNKTVDSFIKITDTSNEIKQFFMEDIELLLEQYSPGSPAMKPDVLKQISELTAKRHLDNATRNQPRIIVSDGKNPDKTMTCDEVSALLQKQRNLIARQINIIHAKDEEIRTIRAQTNNI
jgi:glycosyltransferase involved in cell wall biosynthesis